MRRPFDDLKNWTRAQARAARRNAVRLLARAAKRRNMAENTETIEPEATDLEAAVTELQLRATAARFDHAALEPDALKAVAGAMAVALEETARDVRRGLEVDNEAELVNRMVASVEGLAVAGVALWRLQGAMAEQGITTDPKEAA